jgi:hypothetical protein
MAFCTFPSALLAPVSFALGSNLGVPVHLADRIKVGRKRARKRRVQDFHAGSEGGGCDETTRRLLLSSLFARMFVGGCRVLVSLFAMFVSRFGVLLRLFVLAEIMMMGGLMMMGRQGGNERRLDDDGRWPDALGT